MAPVNLLPISNSPFSHSDGGHRSEQFIATFFQAAAHCSLVPHWMDGIDQAFNVRNLRAWVPVHACEVFVSE
jgi:hypothetical protein